MKGTNSQGANKRASSHPYINTDTKNQVLPNSLDLDQ